MLGQIFIDRYEVEKQLGKSPGRKTLLAKDRQTQELVVIKLLTFGEDFEWQSLKLFEREAEVLKSLDYPAIPQYLDYFEVERGFALVQTYIKAKSLQEYIQSGRTFNETEVERVAAQLLEILTYLHQQLPPIIHRDIKPSNVLLSERTGSDDGNIYLVDFGSVQTAVNVPVGTITIVGTYGYMPMEQFGSQTVPASDLYSLGATLIYLMTGRHPTELPQDDGRIAFEETINLSPGFANWLRWMTEPSLKRRLLSAPSALNALLQKQALISYPPKEPTIFVPDNLSFDVNLDYTRLRDLLTAKNWKQADQETFALALQATCRKKEGWLGSDHIKNFPCTELRTIDQLWVECSDGHFGFSVQKHIWESVGRDLEKFGDSVGWRKGWWIKREWISYSEGTFDISAPEGHLPLRGFRGEGVKSWWGGGGLWIWQWSSFAYRLIKCNL